jgi:hypothetical protein
MEQAMGAYLAVQERAGFRMEKHLLNLASR